MTESPLVFTIRCPSCGATVDVIPVEGRNWNAAHLWGYLAQQAHHDNGCPVLRPGTPSGSGTPPAHPQRRREMTMTMTLPATVDQRDTVLAAEAPAVLPYTLPARLLATMNALTAAGEDAGFRPRVTYLPAGSATDRHGRPTTTDSVELMLRTAERYDNSLQFAHNVLMWCSWTDVVSTQTGACLHTLGQVRAYLATYAARIAGERYGMHGDALDSAYRVATDRPLYGKQLPRQPFTSVPVDQGDAVPAIDLAALAGAVDAALAQAQQPEKPVFDIPRLKPHPTVMEAITASVEKILTGNHKTTVARREALIEDLAQALVDMPVYGIELDCARAAIGDEIDLGNAVIQVDGYGHAVSIWVDGGTPLWGNE